MVYVHYVAVIVLPQLCAARTAENPLEVSAIQNPDSGVTHAHDQALSASLCRQGKSTHTDLPHGSSYTKTLLQYLIQDAHPKESWLVADPRLLSVAMRMLVPPVHETIQRSQASTHEESNRLTQGHTRLTCHDNTIHVLI